MEQCVDVCMPQFVEELEEMVQVITHECISWRIAEQIVDLPVPVPEILEESFEVESGSLQKRQFWNLFVEFVEVVNAVSQLRGPATQHGADRQGSRPADREGNY